MLINLRGYRRSSKRNRYKGPSGDETPLTGEEEEEGRGGGIGDLPRCDLFQLDFASSGVVVLHLLHIKGEKSREEWFLM